MPPSECLPICLEEDLPKARQVVRKHALALGFGLVEQTKLVTATSELARNTLVYGGGGTMELEVLAVGDRSGLRLAFIDHGPGIADLELALKEGYTTGTGLGLGLSGARRLVHDFAIASVVGEGTRVTIACWR